MTRLRGFCRFLIPRAHPAAFFHFLLSSSSAPAASARNASGTESSALHVPSTASRDLIFRGVRVHRPSARGSAMLLMRETTVDFPASATGVTRRELPTSLR